MQTLAVYKTGYYYHSGSWRPFTTTGTPLQGSTVWLSGRGTYTAASAPTTDHYWVGYTCQWIHSAWKCGCRDAACTQNLWQLQGVKYPPSGFEVISRSVDGISGSSATINWSLSEAGTGQIEYGITQSYGSLTTKETSFNYTTHHQNLNGLAPGTTYYYRITSQNRTGQVAQATGLFTTAVRTVSTFYKKACFSEMPDRQAQIAARTFSVKSYGAKGDGVTDDTAAIQAAVDALYAAGGGTLRFPKGKYVVTQVRIEPGIIYEGESKLETILFRPANQGRWRRTLTTQASMHRSDTRPLVIRNLTIDGNAMQQWVPEQVMTHALEQAFLIFLGGDRNIPTRIQGFVENVLLKEGVADGVTVGANADVHICRVEGDNVFRGTYVHVFGYSSAKLYDLYVHGSRGYGGQDIEIEELGGYGDSRSINVEMEKIRIEGGASQAKFQIGANGGTFVGRDIILRDTRISIVGASTTPTKINISDSELTNGPFSGAGSLILGPSDLTFDHVTFSSTKDLSVIVPIIFRGGADCCIPPPGATVRILNSRFSPGTSTSTTMYGINISGSDLGYSLIVENYALDPGMTNILKNCALQTCSIRQDGGDGTTPGKR
jgi:hypothetical protein